MGKREGLNTASRDRDMKYEDRPGDDQNLEVHTDVTREGPT